MKKNNVDREGLDDKSLETKRETWCLQKVKPRWRQVQDLFQKALGSGPPRALVISSATWSMTQATLSNICRLACGWQSHPARERRKGGMTSHAVFF